MDTLKPLCTLPFKSVILDVWQDDKCKQFHPCHHITKNIDDDHCPIHGMPNPLNWNEQSYKLNPKEVLSHPIYKKLQEDMSNGVRNKACQVCWDMDDNLINHDDNHNSKKSYRLDLKPIERDTDGLIVSIFCDNVCNMACRMCTPVASNRFQKDLEVLKISDLENVTDNFFNTNIKTNVTSSSQWKWIKNNSDEIEALSLAGGEPLFNKKVIELLHAISKDINLGLTTNGSMFTTKNCELLNEFKGLYVTLSIDSVYKNYDYIRYPYKFDKLEISIKRFLNLCSNIKDLQINVVVSSLNILEMKSFLEWSSDFHDIHFSEVFPPKRGIGIRNLPLSILEKAYFDIEQIKTRNAHKLKDLINNTIEKIETNSSKMLKEITLFDESRNQDYRKFLNPVLVNWLDEQYCNN